MSTRDTNRAKALAGDQREGEAVASAEPIPTVHPARKPQVPSSILGTGTAPSPPQHARRKWALKWADRLDCATGPYVYRWIVETPWWSLRLHRWVGDDDPRADHDHPWAFYTLILWGGYMDVQHDPQTREVVKVEHLKRGSLAYRPADYAHTVRLYRPSWSQRRWHPYQCWSLVLTGPIVRRWGFFWNGRWWKSNKWFAEHPKFPCDD